MPLPEEPKIILDLRQTKCPLNFVKARLAMDKLCPGECLELWILTDQESAINLPASLQQEGHTLIDDIQEDAYTRLIFIKNS
jgi:TusA-related sulfurtransferase